MIYDDKKAWQELQKAISVAQRCDPEDCDCEKCFIGKPMELVAHDAGVKVVASVCSMLSCLRNICFEPKEYQYRKD